MERGAKDGWSEATARAIILTTPLQLVASLLTAARSSQYGHPYMPEFAVDNKACVHYSKVKDWGEGAKGDWVIVGGGEAGIDAAVALYDNIESGVITVIDKEEGSTPVTPVGDEKALVDDPSMSLAPRTKARLKAAQIDKEHPKKSIKVISDHSCVGVSRCKKASTYTATISKNGSKKGAGTTGLKAAHPIIMSTGFKLATSKSCVLQGLVEWDDTGRPILEDSCDMSTKTDNLFVVGPMVKHDSKGCADEEEKEEEENKKKGKKGSKKKKKTKKELKEELAKKEEEKQDVIFCFVYKFRCR